MAYKSGLGKGLDALIPGGEAAAQPQAASNLIPIDKIKPNPRQPRSQFDLSDLAELASSIQEHGVIQPLVVRFDADSDCYFIIAGERRLQAAQLAGLTSVPAIVRTATDQEQLELALIENIQRTDLSPLELAEAYRQLSDDFNLSQDEIALRVGKARPTVANTSRLLKLPDEAKKELEKNRITEGHARALLSLETPQAQVAVLQKIISNDLTVRQTEDLVKKYGGEKPPQQPKPAVSPEVRDIEDRLRAHLGTKVNLHHGENGGSIVIHYFSDEELNNLLSRIFKE